MSELKLYSSNSCPFAHRSRLMLYEKGVDFELIEIDLSNKPDWFASVSLYTKVPALEQGDVKIYESAIVNEYIDEVYPTPAMVPADPGRRALAPNLGRLLQHSFHFRVRRSTARDRSVGTAGKDRKIAGSLALH